MSFFKFIPKSRKEQPETLVRPSIFVRSLMRRQLFIVMIVCLWSYAAYLWYYVDPVMAKEWSLSPVALGALIGVGLMFQFRLKNILSFYEFVEEQTSMLSGDAQNRGKLNIKGGTVYVIQDADVTGYYKIGKTQQPADRIGHFDTMLPFNVRVVHLITSKDCNALETVLHRHFASKRVRGEWFALTDADVQWIKQMAVA